MNSKEILQGSTITLPPFIDANGERISLAISSDKEEVALKSTKIDSKNKEESAIFISRQGIPKIRSSSGNEFDIIHKGNVDTFINTNPPTNGTTTTRVQEWKNVFYSRAMNGIYTNNTDMPIVLYLLFSVTFNSKPVTAIEVMDKSNKWIPLATTAASTTTAVYITIPPKAVYKVTAPFEAWVELS